MIFAEQYPNLNTGFYTQQITINGTSYTLKIFPNFYMENVEVSILNETGEAIISNIPFVLTENVNYLIGYRGETLNAIQTIISSYVSSTLQSKVKVVIDINNYLR